MDAQTAGPIVPKFGMGIQEHLEIKIGYVLSTWVQGGRREGRRKGGGSVSEGDLTILRLGVQIPVGALFNQSTFILSFHQLFGGFELNYTGNF